MQKITVQVKDDHLELLSRAKPMAALSELIWNGFDAESTEVRVSFEENVLGGTDCVRIRDNGHGLHHQHALVVFKNLGGSWKREGAATALRKRQLHGKFGKGRFRAFALGNHVTWFSVYESDGQRFAFQISGHASRPGEFDVSDPEQVTDDRAVGMTVEIADTPMSTDLLRGVKAGQEVTETFALYMRQYPDVKIFYNNTPIDPANAEERNEELPLGELVMANGERVLASLEIVEWSIPGKRGILLCDQNGFALHTSRRKLNFRGFSYTAYLKSSYCVTLEHQGLLDIEDMASDVGQLLNATRTALRVYFRRREQERAADVLTYWRENGLYPYREDEPVDAREHKIFDIYATHLSHSIEFAELSSRNKGLILRLVRELVGKDPVSVARVLDAFLNLPEGKEEVIRELSSQE